MKAYPRVVRGAEMEPQMCVDSDGKIIKVGSYVCFKQGVEMSGKVTAINAGSVAVEYNDPITDEPKDTIVDARRCWQEGV